MTRLPAIAAAAFAAAIALSCSQQPADGGADASAAPAPAVTSVDDIYTDSVGRWDYGDDIAPESGIPVPVRRIGRLDEAFNDSNYVHWADAEKIGILPIEDTRGHWTTRRPLVRIASCRYYYVEPMTFSKPYLVPEGAALLNEIGRRFHDSLQARGGGDYRPRVTSALRTVDNVRRLRRNNPNAIDSSVHKLGTTFDISYARFTCDNTASTPRSNENLKALLAEILYDLRAEGRCWVKYEKKQPCFHISARPLPKK